MSEYSTSPSRPGSPVGFPPDPSQSAVGAFRFQWDAASHRRGPKSVSETTEGRGGGDYFGLAPHVDIPNASARNLPLGALPSDWSSSAQGFNGKNAAEIPSLFLTVPCSHIHCSEQPTPKSGSPEGSLLTPTCRSCSIAASKAQGFRFIFACSHSRMGEIRTHYTVGSRRAISLRWYFYSPFVDRRSVRPTNSELG